MAPAAAQEQRPAVNDADDAKLPRAFTEYGRKVNDLVDGFLGRAEAELPLDIRSTTRLDRRRVRSRPTRRREVIVVAVERAPSK